MFSQGARTFSRRPVRTPRLQTRFASTSTSTPSTLRRTITATAALVSGTIIAVYYFDSRSALHRYLVTPLLRYTLDPETSHKVAVKVLRSGLAPKDTVVDDERLSAEIFGEKLTNPIGLAAGFDKNGEAIDGLFGLGFSWVEIGSVTPKPQPGNPRPRVFHLPGDCAMINRYGFPSDGSVAVLSRLRARLPRIFSDYPSSEAYSHASLKPHALLAINLGKNKASAPDSIADFVGGVKMFAPYADVLVVNISSPNTPGLRGLQSRGMLEELLVGITKERDLLSIEAQTLTGRRPRIVLKIAPDLSDEKLMDIAEAIKAIKGVDGVIVSNTTIQRPTSLTDPRKVETGGLSGAPLKPLTLRALHTLRTYLPESVPLIGCGGVSSGKDALEYAKSGASIVQLYTGFGYDGVGACRRIKDELAEQLTKEGTTWREVVRKAVKELSEKPLPVAEKKDDGLKTLVDEAMNIKKQLDALSQKFHVEP